MATFPTNNRAYPAYGTSFPAPYTSYSQAMPPAHPIAGNPAQAQAWTSPNGLASHIFPSLPQPHFPSLSSMFGQPQQPMVISVNSPKMTRDEIKKSFLLKVAASTISFVAGLGIIGFIALKILPQRIAMELGAQTHRSLMNTLDENSVAHYLEKIKSHSLAGDSEVSKKLNDKWGAKNATALYRDKKEYAKFTKDIEPYCPLSDTLGLFTRQVVDATITKEYIAEKKVLFCEHGLSNEAKQSLLDKVFINDAVKAELKNVGYEADTKFLELPQAKQDQILNIVFKHATLSDILSSASGEASINALRKTILDRKNVNAAFEKSSVQEKIKAEFQGKGKSFEDAKFDDNDKKAYVLKYLSAEEAFDTLIVGLKPTAQRTIVDIAENIKPSGILGWLLKGKNQP